MILCASSNSKTQPHLRFLHDYFTAGHFEFADQKLRLVNPFEGSISAQDGNLRVYGQYEPVSTWDYVSYVNVVFHER